MLKWTRDVTSSGDMMNNLKRNDETKWSMMVKDERTGWHFAGVLAGIMMATPHNDDPRKAGSQCSRTTRRGLLELPSIGKQRGLVSFPRRDSESVLLRKCQQRRRLQLPRNHY